MPRSQGLESGIYESYWKSMTDVELMKNSFLPHCIALNASNLHDKGQEIGVAKQKSDRVRIA